MSLDLAAVPLALMAGVIGVLSPCVWPLVPVVTSAAAGSGRTGPIYLAGGLSLSFAVAGTLFTWLTVSTGFNPEVFRFFAAALLVTLGAVLVVPAFGNWVTLKLSMLSGSMGIQPGDNPVSAPGQFGVGALLGFVWLPCVGPTLGAAVALAALGQNMPMAFIVMLAYGIGTAGVLLAAGMVSSKVLLRSRSNVIARAQLGKKMLGWSVLVLGLLVLTKTDKLLEAWAVGLLPNWMLSM
jgi:cytochrome c biogenesis protein CcdA